MGDTDMEIFLEEEKAKAMLFVVGGVMKYSSQRRPDLECLVTVGAWVAEAALWSSWIHCGCLLAETASVAFSLDADKFYAIAVADSNAFLHFSKYARLFRERFNITTCADVLDCFDDLQELAHIAFPAVQEAWRPSHIFRRLTRTQRRDTSSANLIGEKAMWLMRQSKTWLVKDGCAGGSSRSRS